MTSQAGSEQFLDSAAWVQVVPVAVILNQLWNRPGLQRSEPLGMLWWCQGPRVAGGFETCVVWGQDSARQRGHSHCQFTPKPSSHALSSSHSLSLPLAVCIRCLSRTPGSTVVLRCHLRPRGHQDSILTFLVLGHFHPPGPLLLLKKY